MKEKRNGGRPELPAERPESPQSKEAFALGTPPVAGYKTDNVNIPQSEGWEKRARGFLWQFVGHDSVAHSRMDGELGDCAGCKADLDEVIEFFESVRKAAYEEGWRTKVSDYEMFEKGYTAGQDSMERVFHTDSIETGKREALESLLTLLPKEKKESTRPSGCPDGMPGCLVYHQEWYMKPEDKMFNDLLSEITSIIRKALTNE